MEEFEENKSPGIGWENVPIEIIPPDSFNAREMKEQLAAILATHIYRKLNSDGTR